ncbi:MAG TPA: MoaD family protein [Desulfobacterales bacterium]|nr:MoaD family protein [Desulfobacterales bacterium]
MGDLPMGVFVHLHKIHRQFTDGLATVEVEGKTVEECLENLVKKYPAMRRAIFKEDNRVANNIEIYVNQTSAYPNEMKKEVNDGDNIHLVVMLAGG